MSLDLSHRAQIPIVSWKLSPCCDFGLLFEAREGVANTASPLCWRPDYSEGHED